MISEIQVKLLENPTNRLMAIADLILADQIVIHDIKIIQNHEGLFLAMPSKKLNNGFADIVHPINQEARATLETLVFYAYQVAKTNDLKTIKMRRKGESTVVSSKLTPDNFHITEAL